MPIDRMSREAKVYHMFDVTKNKYKELKGNMNSYTHKHE